MKTFCMFREDIKSPIFESIYSYNNGSIEFIPENKFKCILPDLYYKKFDDPCFMHNKYLYVKAMNRTGALFACNFYDIGITIIGKDFVGIMFISDYDLKMQEVDTSSFNLFDYNKFSIGLYKTKVNQVEEAQTFVRLLVDEEGVFLNEKGIVNTNITKFYSEEYINSIKGIVKVWRDGYDGILIDNKKSMYIYNIVNNGVKLIKEV